MNIHALDVAGSGVLPELIELAGGPERVVPLPDVLQRLLTAFGPSGHESVAAVFAQAATFLS